MDGFQLWDSRWVWNDNFGTAGDWLIQPPPSADPGVGLRSLEEDDAAAANSGGLQSTDPLATAILLALFTDARLPDYMLGRFGFTRADQHEWHGNTFSIDRTNGEEPLGSLLWTLRRAPLVPYTARLAEHFCALALQPLIRQGLIGSVEVFSETDKPNNRLNIMVRTFDPDRQFKADLAPLR